jgi:hypothetical protein
MPNQRWHSGAYRAWTPTAANAAGGDNMKKLDCFKSGKLADAARRIRFGGPAGAAVMSALLAGCILAVGCSHKESKPAATETQTSANQMALNQPVVPTPVSSVTPTATSEPKKVVKKRPSTVKYNDQTYGVSFRYPWQYSLKNGDGIDSESVPMDFVQPGGEAAVSVDVPKGFYPDTDFASAFFRVNVNRNVTQADCDAFASSQTSDKNAIQPSKLALGGLELQEIEEVSGDDTTQADTKYYHAFQNGACYEFALGLSTASDTNDDSMPVNREKVFRRLEMILATVKINPQATPQVAGSAATPTAQNEPTK